LENTNRFCFEFYETNICFEYVKFEYIEKLEYNVFVDKEIFCSITFSPIVDINFYLTLAKKTSSIIFDLEEDEFAICVSRLYLILDKVDNN